MEDNKHEMTIEEIEEQMNNALNAYKSLSKTLKSKKEEEENARSKKLESDKTERKKKVDEVLAEADDAIRVYLKDYGELNINKNYHYLHFIFGKRINPFFL